MASTEATTHPRPHVSVIVAAYSVEPFLRQCLDSIAAQTLHDIEVICVNDGSPDNSLAIMEEFASRDERFQVVDKPNGGYGSAVNAGLSRAKGEYISIVEPDDFIDEHMLEDLFGFTTFQSNTPVDVVKSSYREYYDALDGIGDSLVTPEHDYSMPLQPVSFSIEEHPVLLCMHPSVWSAIYRREFLEAQGIRMVEAPGSGWVDNPFLYQTLTQANRIVWVPNHYYYYRQTTGATKPFSNYHDPFDRMRDIRAFLHSIKPHDNVWAAFYRVQFNYIGLLKNWGVDDNDPEINQLVREMLQDMNPDIVYTNILCTTRNMNYYSTFLGLPPYEELPEELPEGPTEAARNDDPPALSVIVPLADNAEYARESLELLAAELPDSCEVILVGGGSRDITTLVARTFADMHERFRYQAGQGPYHEMVNSAIEQAKGLYLLFVDLPCVLFPGRLQRNLLDAMTKDADVFVCDEEELYGVPAQRACHMIGQVEPYTYDNATTSVFISPAIAPTDIAAFALNCSPSHMSTALIRRSLIDKHGLRILPEECGFSASLCNRAILCASRLVYCSQKLLARRFREFYPHALPHQLSPDNAIIRERPSTLPGIIRIAENLDPNSPFSQSAACMVLDSFMKDMQERRTSFSLSRFFQENFARVERIVDRFPDPRSYAITYNYYLFQLIKRDGLAGWAATEHERQRNWKEGIDEELTSVLDSATMHLGERTRDLVTRLLPRKAIGKIRSRIASK